MTNTHQNFGRLVTSTISLALLICALVGGSVAQAPTLSKQELKTLLATAKTPSDQERLAAYYRDKAQHLRAKAQEFSAQADSMAGQPAILESKQGISCPCALHYRYFAKQYAQEAKDADALAAQHDQLAQTDQSKGTEK